MCVAMPGEVVDVKDGTASVSFGTIKKNIVTTLIPDLKIGDYVLVQALQLLRLKRQKLRKL